MSRNAFSWSLDRNRPVTPSGSVPDCDVGVIVLSLLWEAGSRAYITRRLREGIALVRSKFATADIVVVLNSWYRSLDLSIAGVQSITYIDFFLMQVYNRTFGLTQLDHAQQWHRDRSRFLFLTGKPNKMNRVRLLYLLQQAGLCNRMTWSFFMPPSQLTACHAWLPELSRAEYENFVADMSSNPDHVQAFGCDASMHYSGIPFDANIYSDSLFQLISETYFDNGIEQNAWITEKTWLAVLNHRPFIMAGEPGTLAKLNRMGFRTFERYLARPDYDRIEDPASRLLAIVENVESWLDDPILHADEISRDVDHNYVRFQHLAKQNYRDLAAWLHDHGLDVALDQVIELHDYLATDRWRIFYENVRAESWPDCDYLEQFHELPTHIQQECMEIFQYQHGGKI